jgi:hypothetical protein
MANLSPDNNGYNIFAAKACQCLRALGSVMVMIVLGLILLTYYTTVFCVYGRLALGHSNKAGIATVVIVIYNGLVRRQAGLHACRGFRAEQVAAGPTPCLCALAGVHAAVELLCGGADGAGARAARLAAERGG